MAKLKTGTRNRATDGITTDAGTTAFIWIFTGSGPGKTSNVFNSNTGTLLVKLACANPLGSASSLGVLTLGAITNGTAVGTGTPGYFRLCTDSTTTDGSTVIVEGTCAVGSGELNFASTIASGGTVSISSFTITEGNA